VPFQLELYLHSLDISFQFSSVVASSKKHISFSEPVESQKDLLSELKEAIWAVLIDSDDLVQEMAAIVIFRLFSVLQLDLASDPVVEHQVDVNILDACLLCLGQVEVVLHFNDLQAFCIVENFESLNELFLILNGDSCSDHIVDLERRIFSDDLFSNSSKISFHATSNIYFLKFREHLVDLILESPIALKRILIQNKCLLMGS